MHRVFDQEQLRDEELLELVRAGTQAPMAGNVLLRHLIVVTDYRVIKSLREVTPDPRLPAETNEAISGRPSGLRI